MSTAVEQAVPLVKKVPQQQVSFDLPGVGGESKLMTMGFQRIGTSRQLLFTQPTGEQLRVVPNGAGFVFANEKDLVIGERVKGRFLPWRLDLSKLREGWKDPDKLRGLIRQGTNVFLVALAVWIGTKVAIIVLAGVAFVAFLTMIVGIFLALTGPAIKAFKDLLKTAGINDKEMEQFLLKASRMTREVLRATVEEFRKMQQLQFAQ